MGGGSSSGNSVTVGSEGRRPIDLQERHDQVNLISLANFLLPYGQWYKARACVTSKEVR